MLRRRLGVRNSPFDAIGIARDLRYFLLPRNDHGMTVDSSAPQMRDLADSNLVPAL